MMLGGGGGKGNTKGDRGKGHGNPLERHSEFEERNLVGSGDEEEVSQKEESKRKGDFVDFVAIY